MTFKTRYSGTVTKTFTIKPKATTISSLSSGGGEITVRWKKVKEQITGYEIRYSTNKNFNKFKTKKVTAKNTKVTIKNVNTNKRYYIRVRTYKVVNGEKIYSAWSSIMSTK